MVVNVYHSAVARGHTKGALEVQVWLLVYGSVQINPFVKQPDSLRGASKAQRCRRTGEPPIECHGKREGSANRLHCGMEFSSPWRS